MADLLGDIEKELLDDDGNYDVELGHPSSSSGPAGADPDSEPPSPPRSESPDLELAMDVPSRKNFASHGPTSDTEPLMAQTRADAAAATSGSSILFDPTKTSSSTGGYSGGAGGGGGSGDGTPSQRKERLSKMFFEEDDTWIGWIKTWLNKGSVSNLISFCIMLVGWILNSSYQTKFTEYILALGLFGFSGGITNWLAVKMLFDRIPFLYGSGVIPRRFKHIRETVKDTIMETFFDETYLNKYLSTKVHQVASSLNIDQKIAEVMASEKVDKIIEKKLQELGSRPEGAFMVMMGLQPMSLKPVIKPFVQGFGSEVATLLIDLVSEPGTINIGRLRDELDGLMTTKLLELTPDKVKKLMEKVIREHLGWLIVWGNVFGGLIGVLAKAAGY
eukprot:Rmarinus@m.6152